MSTQFNFGSVNPMTTTSAFTFGASGQPSVSLPSLSTTSSGFTFGTNINPLQSSTTLVANPNPGLTLTLTNTSTAVTQTTTQQTNSFHGLGGTQTTSSESSADQSLKANKANKESFIPPEVMTLVEALKQFVKQQKLIREENSQQRFSIQPIAEVGAQIEDSLRLFLHKIEIDIQRNSKAIDNMKKDTNKLLSSAEMAYSISRMDFSQTPSSYTIAQNKYINVSTHQYFVEMIEGFEQQMNNYSKQIQDLKTHIENMNKPYTSEELLQIMRKQHQTLISLAAKVYAIHEDINQLKLNLKNQNYSTKLTEKKSEVITTMSSSATTMNSFVGPNPFSFCGEETERNVNSTLLLNQSIGNTVNPFSSVISSPLNPLTTSSAQFPQLSSSTINSSHSRAKRWTTS